MHNSGGIRVLSESGYQFTLGVPP